VVDVSTQTYLNLSIVLDADDRWTYEITGAGRGGPSIVFHLSKAANIYADIDALEAFIGELTASLNEAKTVDRRMRQAALHGLAGN
jgi:hypothetical protein